ncbi:MAG: efflux RND transporter periplasmic adaptor subunit [Alcanivorax sp.]|nr:efflux RND transporter periplasmic adaptor subunit [Alcanivorax sp.]
MNNWIGRHRKTVMALACGLVLLIVAGFWAGRDKAAPQWQTAPVVRTDIENVVTALGTLEPSDYVDVGAQVSGQLTHLYVDVGDRVKQGQLLAQIDASVQQSKVDAGLAELQALRAQLQQQQAQLQLAQLQFRRQQNLRQADATSDAAYQSARASLAVTRAQIAVLKAQIQQKQSTVDGDQATLGYAKIFAPRDGTVVTLDAREGQTLNANQTAPVLMRIADLSTMQVSAQVSEADVDSLKVGMPVYFSTLGNSKVRYHSALAQILPTPEEVNNVVLYTARFRIDNSKGRLMSGMTAQAFFVVAAAKAVLAVPVAALQDGPQGPRVQVMDAGGTPRWQPVTVGISNRIQVQVSGLRQGQTVVTGKLAAPPADSGSRRRGWF